ncbi:MAG TPA: gephyrin-like molybdotransferase Glp [Terriglobales bacterium]|nr:gephyrin-like molybdotransferase Glp [Terriglobales bacterium]
MKVVAEVRLSFNGHAPQRECDLAAARGCVLDHARALAGGLRCESVPRQCAGGRVLAQQVLADRDFPPFPRAMRDGYALRAADATRPLPCLGSARAGAAFPHALAPGACVEIMTGAPVPAGADAVVMVERTRTGHRYSEAGLPGIEARPPSDQRERPRQKVANPIPDDVLVEAEVRAGDNIAPIGSDARRGAALLVPGRRLGPAALAVLASAGCAQPLVVARPRVAVLATGDELVPADQLPGPFQIRNSNGPMLAALVEQCGGQVVAEEGLPDRSSAIQHALRRWLPQADLILFSGGASVGTHDQVAPALAASGAEFFFDAVRIRPGRPVLFGACDRRLFFGLPGNPVAALLAFQLLVRPALALLGGALVPPPAWANATLGFKFQARPQPLLVFRPVRWAPAAPVIQPVHYAGAADLAAAAAADAFLMIPEETASLPAGAAVQVVPL